MAQVNDPLLPLHGTWEGTVNGNRYVEQWTCANGVCDGSATSYGGDTVAMKETTRIMEFAGQWLYLVAAGEGPVIAFVRITANDSTWTFENTGLDRVPVFQVRQQTLTWDYNPYEIDYVTNQGVIYAGTHGRGAFRTEKFLSIAPLQGGSGAQGEVSDLTIFPNPASITTTIAIHDSFSDALSLSLS